MLWILQHLSCICLFSTRVPFIYHCSITFTVTSIHLDILHCLLHKLSRFLSILIRWIFMTMPLYMSGLISNNASNASMFLYYVPYVLCSWYNNVNTYYLSYCNWFLWKLEAVELTRMSKRDAVKLLYFWKKKKRFINFSIQSKRKIQFLTIHLCVEGIWYKRK